MFAIIFCKLMCLPLNLLGVSGSDSTLYESFPLRISMELIRKSRLLFSLMESLDANAFRTNRKLGTASGFCLDKFILKPNNCTLLMAIFPLNRGRISNLAERRVTFNISFPVWSLSKRSSIMILFKAPADIFPIESSVPRILRSS